MDFRKFQVGNWRAGNKTVTKYVVTNAATNDEMTDGTHPPVAEFPVSVLYDEKSQYDRAELFCEYMNKIVDATKIAYEQTALCDILRK